MPVEIRELVIRAVTSSESESPESQPVNRGESEDREAIVEACVKQVMRILKKTKER